MRKTMLPAALLALLGIGFIITGASLDCYVEAETDRLTETDIHCILFGGQLLLLALLYSLALYGLRAVSAWRRRHKMPPAALRRDAATNRRHASASSVSDARTPGSESSPDNGRPDDGPSTHARQPR